MTDEEILQRVGPSYYEELRFMPGLLEFGNVDLENRPMVPTPEGDIATVFSHAETLPDGTVVSFPGVSEDGRLMDFNEALDEYNKTGNFFGRFTGENEQDAIANEEAFADLLHRLQEQEYVNTMV